MIPSLLVDRLFIGAYLLTNLRRHMENHFRPTTYPVLEILKSFFKRFFILSDYVGFIKKIMKLMQLQYPMLAKVEVEMTQEKEMDELPNRPSKFFYTLKVFSKKKKERINFMLIALFLQVKLSKDGGFFKKYLWKRVGQTFRNQLIIKIP